MELYNAFVFLWEFWIAYFCTEEFAIQLIMLIELLKICVHFIYAIYIIYVFLIFI